MGKVLAEAFDICRKTFMEPGKALGERLTALCFEGPEDRPMLTENAQPAILAATDH
jgi:[acyl-carrier-protein] S-malonyltransferase